MIQRYIEEILENQGAISHEWSNWDPYELIAEPDENTIDALNEVSLVGNLSFVVGCIELVTHRCAYDDYTLPYEYIEAFWVHLSGLKTIVPDEVTDDDRWEGRLDGPVNLVIGKFYTTNHTSDYGGSPVEAAYSAQVALHVLTKKEPFLHWQSLVLERLLKEFPKGKASQEEEIASSRILDPDAEYSRMIALHDIKRMLTSINCSSNRFLQGFEKDILSYVADLE